MKGKKYKRSEASMKKIYEKCFGLRQPYQVFVDAEFCRALLKSKIIAKDTFPEVLGGAVKILASCCVLDELRRLDESEEDGVTGSVFIAKRFEMRNCRHKPAKSAVECIAELVGTTNPHHYAVAVQNYELRKQLREVLGVPLVFVSHGVVLMEEPTKAAREHAYQKELGKLKPQAFELRALTKAAEPKATPASSEEEEKKKRKKRKGKRMPNPLSVKRPKAAPQAAKNPEPAKPKRKRKTRAKAGAPQ